MRSRLERRGEKMQAELWSFLHLLLLLLLLLLLFVRCYLWGWWWWWYFCRIRVHLVHSRERRFHRCACPRPPLGTIGGRHVSFVLCPGLFGIALTFSTQFPNVLYPPPTTGFGRSVCAPSNCRSLCANHSAVHPAQVSGGPAQARRRPREDRQHHGEISSRLE